MAARGRDEKPFLSRWSQRKQRAAEDEAAPTPQVGAETNAEPDAAPQEIDPDTLPDVDSLDAGSDFTVFMREGVPKALKQRALRRLWQVDPAFRHICMLDDYNLDYTDAATVVPNLKTLYQVGRGMVLPNVEPENASGADHAAALPSGASESAQASLPSPDVAAEPEQAEEQQREAIDEPASDRAVADESASATAHRRRAVSLPSSQEATRSARRRRWGDEEE